MMDEFVSRMGTQRYIVNVVNLKYPLYERLFGLSSEAIDRWCLENQLIPKSEVVELLKAVSSELFFLATRSQEPVSSEYELRRDRILGLVTQIEGIKGQS